MMSEIQSPKTGKPIIRLVCVALLLSASGCASYSLVSAAGPANVGGGLAVQPPMAWNKAPGTGGGSLTVGQVWTLDGESLNEMLLVGGLPAGKTLFKDDRKRERPLPKFKADALPQELAEFFENSYRTVSGTTAFKVSNIAPAELGGSKGVRFEYDFTNPYDEVPRRGRALAVIKDSKLYFIAFQAAATYYFDRDVQAFERIVASARIG